MGVAEHTTNNQPLVTMLYLVKPNPATRGLSQISFSLSEPQKVAIRIFDISGRLIKTLVNEQKNTGNYSLIWNGTDDNNREVSEGVYFCILKTDEKSLKQKILLVK
jgi:flagellar hook assembly protein FlgD